MTSTANPTLSPARFSAEYESFQALHRKLDGGPLASFASTTSLAHRDEGYKSKLPGRAEQNIAPWDWVADFGRGAIRDAVVRGIEIDGNNLVSWEPRWGEAARPHRRMLTADGSALKVLDELLFRLYRQGETLEEVFAGSSGSAADGTSFSPTSSSSPTRASSFPVGRVRSRRPSSSSECPIA